MREIVNIPYAEVKPSAAAVRRAVGYHDGRLPAERIAALLEEAREMLAATAAPAGIWAAIDEARFAEVYRGAGQNDDDTPLAGIFPHADHLALMATTVGSAVSTRIRRLFDGHDYALASLLDAAASEAAELAADAVQARFAARLPPGAHLRLLRYSPGYCGWHVSGQAALFAALRPEKIGISLSETHLMEPIKSVSAVIVAGRPEIHAFEMRFPFCATCRTKACRARIRQVLGSVAGARNGEKS